MDDEEYDKWFWKMSKQIFEDTQGILRALAGEPCSSCVKPSEDDCKKCEKAIQLDYTSSENGDNVEDQDLRSKDCDEDMHKYMRALAGEPCCSCKRPDSECEQCKKEMRDAHIKEYDEIYGRGKSICRCKKPIPYTVGNSVSCRKCGGMI